MEKRFFRSKKSENGFSLAELLVAAGVLAIAIIYVVGLFTSLMQSSEKGENLSVATLLAQSYLERVKNDSLLLKEALQETESANPNEKTVYLIGSGENTQGANHFTNKLTFHYRIKARQYSLSPEQNYYVVDSEIFWYGDPSHVNPSRIGQGLTSTHLTTAFYQRR